MADVEATPAPATETTPKKSGKKTAAKKTKAAGDKAKKSTHPPTAVMVTAAIKSLKDRGGSSLQAIKKYMAATYKVDVEKMAPFIKKYLKGTVISGDLIQTKGKGASGRFKLATAEKKPKAVTTKTVAVKPKSVAAKPAAKPVAKKSPAKARKPAPKKTAKTVAAPKAKKTTKPPTKKPKTPKAKTTKPKATARGRKASPKKK